MTFISLAVPRLNVAQAFRSLVNEFRTFSSEFKFTYDWAVANHMNMLVDLQKSGGIESTTRVWIAVEDAASCHCSVRWREIFWQVARRRFAVQAAIYGGIILCLIGLSYIIPKPTIIYQKNYDNGFASGALLTLLFVGGFLYFRLPSRCRTSVLLIAAIMSGVAVKKFAVWSPYVHSAWVSAISALSSLNVMNEKQVTAVPIAHSLQWALFYIMLICIYVWVIRVINLSGKALASGKEFGYGRSAEGCAEVIIKLLNIAHSMTELLNPPPVISDSTEISMRDKIAFKWLNGQRQYLEGEFNGLALAIRGSWRKAMRESYKPAGKLIAGEAPRIELFIRHQQAKNALQGNLHELRDSITSTLIHAAGGNWHLIGVEEEYADKIVLQRRTRIIRRAILITVMVGFAAAAPHFMQHYPTLYSSIVAVCISFALVEVAGLLDPDAPTRLDIAGRVAGMFKRGNG
jgi:hypothetical protein